MARYKKSVERSKRKRVEPLDYHEGLSVNQVKIICRELGLDYDKFFPWMDGQTRPIILRTDEKGKPIQVGGVFEYDLFRWVENQKKGTPLIWD